MPQTHIREIPWRRIITYVTVTLVGLVLFALVASAVLRARDAARKSTSRNNLKMIGIALHNYHSTHDRLPPGGVIAGNGTAQHGWCTSILPYMDASPLYSMTDFNRPWNDDANRYVFQSSYPSYWLPGVDPKFTADGGYALIHYMGNPNLLHRNSSVSFDDCTAGLANTWFVGEAQGNYQPWGYPFNWRPLGTRLSSGPDSFGRPTGDGAFILTVDGSVRFFSNETSANVLKALANAPPIAKAELLIRPEAYFEYASSSGWTREGIDLDEHDPNGLSAVITIDSKGVPRRVYFSGKSKASARPAKLNDIKRIAAKYPDLRESISCPTVDDRMAAALSAFTKLETLRTVSVTVSDRGAQSLKPLTRLKLIRARTISPGVRARLKSVLPNCEVRIETTSE